MALSEREQRLLSEMEDRLISEDPRFASTMRGKHPNFSVGRLAAGLGGVVVGIAVLLLGVAFKMPLVGVLGFAIMLAAAVYGFTGKSKTADKPQLRVVGGSNRSTARSKKSSSGGSLVQRMEDRWNRRRESGDF